MHFSGKSPSFLFNRLTSFRILSMYDISISLRVVRSARFDNDLDGLAEVTLRATYAGSSIMDPTMQGQTYFRRQFQAVTISLYASTDNQFSSDDALLVSQNTLFSATFSTFIRNLVFSTANLTVAEGSYYLIARVQGMTGMETGQVLVNNQSLQLTNALGADPFIQWTSCALNVVKSAGSNGKAGIGPTAGSRLMAMVSTAMLNTLAGFDETVQPYRIDQNAPAGANRDAALAAAAHRILSLEVPGELSLIQDQYNRILQGTSATSASITAGVEFGIAMADQIRSLRSSDGSTNTTPYTPPTPTSGLPGYVWMPATSGPMQGVALGPNWGSVTPWVISSAVAFSSNGLQGRPGVNSANDALYATQIEEVRRFGGLANTSATTLERTQDQTDIALFWAYDRPNTFRPYGHLLDIAMDVVSGLNTSLATNAKLLTSLSLAMADAVICAWREKYSEAQPRPWDVITGFAANDGLDATVHDPNWQSLLSSINGIQSPPFPDFLSGHSTMGGTFASVMTHFLGDNISFSARSDDLPGKVRHFDGMEYEGVPRNSFFEAGWEDAISRVYGGVHVREACLDSLDVGLRVGNAVVTTPWMPPIS
jgi:hypothetical protein